MKKIVTITVAAALVAGCNPFNRARPKTPVVGERVAVLTNEADIVVDEATAAAPFSLPAAEANAAWNQPGGNASKSLGHLALGNALGTAYSIQAGSGTRVDARLASSPVVENGRVFTIDTTATVRAFDAQTGATTPPCSAVACRSRTAGSTPPTASASWRRWTRATERSSGRCVRAAPCAVLRPSPATRST